MKIRTTQKEVYKMLLWYSQELYKNFVGKLMTPANVELAKRELHYLQQSKQQNETNRIWEIPVGIIDYPKTQSFEVNVISYDNVLLLDFDK